MRNDLDTLSERFHDKDNDEDDVINVRPGKKIPQLEHLEIQGVFTGCVLPETPMHSHEFVYNQVDSDQTQITDINSYKPLLHSSIRP